MGTETAPSWQHDVDVALDDLVAAAPRLAATTPLQRAALARECLRGIAPVSDEWAQIAASAKGLDRGSPWVGEELVIGPLAVTRYLQLIARSLDDLSDGGLPRLPGTPRTDDEGRLRVPVLPVKGLFDGVAFKGFSAEVILADGVISAYGSADLANRARNPEPGVSLVLGAGNVSSIAVVDALAQILAEGRTCYLKLHPHFAGLAPLLEGALASLVHPGFLRIAEGGGDVGAFTAYDARVGLVHITGSGESFDRLVWGDDPSDAARRRAEETPLLDKPVIAELGSVTPWIIVPGVWSDKELQFQAENLAGSIISNGSFNCICPKVIITSRGWPQRERFLEVLRGILGAVPPRPAFYGGALDRYFELVGEPAGAAPGCLPWTLLRDADPDSRPELFMRENFLPVSAETPLDETDPARFLDAATRFANERLAGTLAATVVVHPRQRTSGPVAEALERSISGLRYGTVCINQFAGLSFVMMSTPWGGYAGGVLTDPESGVGFAHNTYMLDGIEKTVFEGPFRISPKPLWFPSNRNGVRIAQALTNLYQHPSLGRLARLLLQALRA